MSGYSLHRHYEDWPADPEKREALARELFGECIMAAYNGCLKFASDLLFHGLCYKSPTEEERKLLDWIASLGDEDRARVFAFGRELLSSLVFSILNEFDGTTGFLLRGAVREQLRVAVAFTGWNGEAGWAPEAPVEVITINSRESREEKGIELHRLWFHWKEKYSHRQGEPGGGW